MAGHPGPAGDAGGRDHPERLGAYRVEGLIGAGGMGVVYRALDEALQRQVAIKTLLPALTADPEFVARFKREAQSAAALNHPNITQIYAIGQEGELPFFAMELIHGTSLDTLTHDRGPLDPQTACGYILQAARGLRHAAQRGLIHRDVKPSNLMLTDEGIVKITDFGLAKTTRSESHLTATGEVLGSPGYISPEQAQGIAIDARSDIYSLGASFYQLLTGKLPFDAPTSVAMILKHLSEPVRSPRALNPNIPYPIASVVQRMMAKRPGERFQDYDALIREIDRAVGAAASGVTSTVAGLNFAASGGAAMEGAGPASSRPAVPPLQATSARQGPRARPSAPAAAPVEAERRSGSSLPLLLAAVLGVLVTLGILKHRRDASAEVDPSPSHAGMTAGDDASAGRSPIEVGQTFTTRPVGTPEDSAARGAPLFERLREAAVGRADLKFVTNDHETLSDGRLRVMGQVRNDGNGTASQARVRIRILLENGALAAQGETPLTPSLIPPGHTAGFSMPLDYSGPVATIKAELVWVQ